MPLPLNSRAKRPYAPSQSASLPAIRVSKMDDGIDSFKERDTAAIDRVLASIRAVWIKHPSWRLGQLIVSAVDPPDMCPDLFGMGDDRLVGRVQAFGRFLDAPPPATH